MKPKVIHTETFSCADDHPIVWYTFDKNNEAICEYCSAKFIFKPKDFHDKMVEEKELLDMSMKESIRQKEERTADHYIPGITKRPTPSEKMQDELEPIDDDHVNRVLKGSG
jgi:DNA-directed RNA polymerase subunit RPC12/RpoP